MSLIFLKEHADYVVQLSGVPELPWGQPVGVEGVPREKVQAARDRTIAHTTSFVMHELLAPCQKKKKKDIQALIPGTYEHDLTWK